MIFNWDAIGKGKNIGNSKSALCYTGLKHCGKGKTIYDELTYKHA